MKWLLFTSSKARQRQRRAFIDGFAWPDGLTRRFAEKHPALSATNCDLAFDGLRQYFRVCLVAEKRIISMPSQVVDDAWHEFLLYTRAYDEFCRAAFGRFLHHTPAEAMQTSTSAQDGIRRAWRLSCRDDRINPRFPERLPLLFAIDAALQIPDGFRYDLNCLGFNRAQSGDGTTYCATHIGCGGGCSSGCGGDSGGAHGSDSGGDGGAHGCGGSGCGGGGD